MTLATLPSLTTTCGSVIAPEYFDLHADSALMSIAGFAGAAPANDTVPVIEALPCGPFACVAPALVSEFDEAASSCFPPHANATTAVTTAVQTNARFIFKPPGGNLQASARDAGLARLR